METEQTNCPNCGAEPEQQIYELADYLYHTPGTFSMQRCGACGLLFLSPRPTPNSIMDYYPAEYNPYRPAIQDEKRAIVQMMRLAKIARHRKMVERHSPVMAGQGVAGRVLDVGCSTGIFLDEMRSSGWDVQGIELNHEAAQYARSRLQLSVHGDDLLALDMEQIGGEASLDAVTMWNVLEHTFDPSAILGRCRTLLREGGIVAFTIPNWESLDRYLFGRYWIGFDTPRHLFVFPNQTLENILHEQGFELVVNCCLFGGYYAFIQSVFAWSRTNLAPTTAQKIERLLHFPGLRFLFEPFFMAADSLGIGSIRCVVARKIAPK